MTLVGQTFNPLTVLARESSSGKNSRWLCQCDCGTKRVVFRGSLTSGNTQSCGCLHREKATEQAVQRNTTHGLSKTRFYKLWDGIQQRTENPNHREYKRGIRMCDEWRNNPASFVKWCEEQNPPKGYSIDRYPDNDGPYAPWNCRFATAKQQANNRRPRGTAL